MSNLYSVACGKNESAAVGKKAIEIDFEEAGKCVAKGTRFIMFDGSIKNVEDIVAGDVLMGPDSKPRTVLATTHGIDNMYKVIYVKKQDMLVPDWEQTIAKLKETLY